jgi:hypothetical protein
MVTTGVEDNVSRPGAVYELRNCDETTATQLLSIKKPAANRNYNTFRGTLL